MAMLFWDPRFFKAQIALLGVSLAFSAGQLLTAAAKRTGPTDPGAIVMLAAVVVTLCVMSVFFIVKSRQAGTSEAKRTYDVGRTYAVFWLYLSSFSLAAGCALELLGLFRWWEW